MRFLFIITQLRKRATIFSQYIVENDFWISEKNYLESTFFACIFCLKALNLMSMLFDSSSEMKKNDLARKIICQGR